MSLFLARECITACTRSKASEMYIIWVTVKSHSFILTWVSNKLSQKWNDHHLDKAQNYRVHAFNLIISQNK